MPSWVPHILGIVPLCSTCVARDLLTWHVCTGVKVLPSSTLPTIIVCMQTQMINRMVKSRQNDLSEDYPLQPAHVPILWVAGGTQQQQRVAHTLHANASLLNTRLLYGVDQRFYLTAQCHPVLGGLMLRCMLRILCCIQSFLRRLKAGNGTWWTPSVID